MVHKSPCLIPIAIRHFKHVPVHALILSDFFLLYRRAQAKRGRAPPSLYCNKLSHFIFSHYVHPDGNISWLAVTQFESLGARKSFPCLDEPDKKAKFDVKLGRKPNMTTVSNMPIVYSDSIIHNMVMDTFNTSVEMSTYLVAFLVSDFDYTPNENDTTFKIWHLPVS